MLAGTGIAGDELLLLQQKLIAKASGATEADIQKSQKINTAIFAMVTHSTNTQALQAAVTNYLQQLLKDTSAAPSLNGMSSEDFVKTGVNQVTGPWMQYFI